MEIAPVAFRSKNPCNKKAAPLPKFTTVATTLFLFDFFCVREFSVPRVEKADLRSPFFIARVPDRHNVEVSGIIKHFYTAPVQRIACNGGGRRFRIARREEQVVLTATGRRCFGA